MLLEAGTDPTRCASRWTGDTYSAISYALVNCEDYRVKDALAVLERLLAVGARPTGAEAAALRRLGREHQRSLAAYRRHSPGEESPELDARTAALDRLCQICGVEPAAEIVLHDGVSPIEVPEGSWKSAYRTLWDTLVPGSGPADTAQGEAVRIAGRIGNELLGNGGANWDDAYRRLVDGLAELLASGTPLEPVDLADARARLGHLRSGTMNPPAIDRITELTVEWVRLNPQPVANPLPDVGR